MTRARAVLTAGFLALAAIVGPVPHDAVAQGNPFAPAVRVDDMAITEFQVAQRARFLSLLRAPDADRDGATKGLIDEALQARAARVAGITLTPEQLDAGLVEFAARADLTPDQFVAELGKAGVAPETFRDFVRNGLYWRGLIQERFGDRARPSDSVVRGAAERAGPGAAGVRLLLSEIALPLTPETRDAQTALAQRLSDTVRGQAAFEAAARQYSASNTAARGGTVDWLPLDGLSPQIASQVLTLAPGEVSEPVNLGGFIALFLLRDLDENAAPAKASQVDYAEYLIPGGRTREGLSAAARLRARVDTCDDLYGVAKGQPAGVLTRATVSPSDLPADLRQALSTLDPGDVSTVLERGGFLRFVMLCGRPVEADDERFQALGQQILNQRLGTYADGYLDELRADAVITRP